MFACYAELLITSIESYRLLVGSTSNLKYIMISG